MLIAVLDPVHPATVDTLLTEGFEVLTWQDPGVADWPRTADGVIIRNATIDGSLMRTAEKLKVIGKHGVGTDSIDLEMARQLGVKVVNAPGANSRSVAELALGLTLALARNVALYDRSLRTAEGAERIPVTSGIELYGKTVGVIGCGAVGGSVAELYQRGFDATVRVYDPYLSAASLQDRGLLPADKLHALLELSDIVSLHVPLTAETRGLMGFVELATMRSTALLINTARGGVVDEDALFHALESGVIAGCASDVFQSEPPDPGHPLLSLDNFVATPHLGAATAESMIRTGELVAREVIAVLRSEQPSHLVA